VGAVVGRSCVGFNRTASIYYGLSKAPKRSKQLGNYPIISSFSLNVHSSLPFMDLKIIDWYGNSL
jgi:hypothetical protein